MNTKKSFDQSAQSFGSTLDDSKDFQIPETPERIRNAHRDDSMKHTEKHENTAQPGSPFNGGRENGRLQTWPFGPRLKCSGTVHRSAERTTQNQVEETPITRRMNGSSDLEKPGNRKASLLQSEVPSPGKSSLLAAVDAFREPVKLPDDKDSAPPQHSDISELKVETIPDSQLLHDVEEKLRIAHESAAKTKAEHEEAMKSKDHALVKVNVIIDTLQGRVQKALQDKETELQQSRADLEILRIENNTALQARELELQKAKDDVARLTQQLVVRDDKAEDGELVQLKTEVTALKQQIVSSERKPEKVEPKFNHTNLFTAAPELLPDVVFFDADAKKKEIEKRRTRKQTFGRRLANIRRERGQYPHREVYRHSQKPSQVFGNLTFFPAEESTETSPTKRRELQDLGPGETVDPGANDEETRPLSFEDLMGVPINAIPCIVDSQLAYRDGTRVSFFSLRFHPISLNWIFVGCEGATASRQSYIQGRAQRCRAT